MADVQWSQEQLPPPKKGMSTGVKVALGCGVLMLAGLGTCVGAGIFGAHKLTSMGDSEWVEMKKDADLLMSDDGTKRLYASNPALAEAYPTEDEFLHEVQIWRPKLEALPAQRPDLMSGRFSYGMNVVNGSKNVIASYTTTKGDMLLFFFKDGQLRSISLREGALKPTFDQRTMNPNMPSMPSMPSAPSAPAPSEVPVAPPAVPPSVPPTP
jgi:hypothetical protein